METITYTIGDDILTQASTITAKGIKHLLYDGHGSTRQLADTSGAVNSADSFSYDAYGVLLQSNDVTPAGRTPAQNTHLLYAGEYFDAHSQHYYNRARWYNPSNGRFNQMDPYAGSPSDPQSLHKYLYCHANPINGIDPSGCWTWVGVTIAIVVVALLITVYYGCVHRPLVGPLLLMRNSRPMDEQIINDIVFSIDQYWQRNSKMQNMKSCLSDGRISVRVIEANRYAEGIHLMNNIFISENAIYDVSTNGQRIRRLPHETALVVFAEFQHHTLGGGLNEQAAQEEFIRVRDLLPQRARTQYINTRHHGGTENE